MRIVVCIQQVLDPEVPPQAFRLDGSGRRPVVVGVPAAQVLDSYAENALELGLQLRDAVSGSKVTALCVGDAGADEGLRQAFALTADAAARVWEDDWAERELDGLAVAHVLARAIAALGGADLVLCGRQAADIEEGVVGPALAEELGAACVTLAQRVETVDGGLRIRREADGLIETASTPLPAVVSVTSAEGNVPRMARIKDRMLAARKPIRVLRAAELAPDPVRLAAGVWLERLELPAVGSRCELLKGEPADQAAALAHRLEALKLL